MRNFKDINLFNPKENYYVSGGEYGQYDEFYSLQQQMHWLPNEVTLGQDVVDWYSGMTEGERGLATEIFRLFTQMDLLVNNNYADSLLPMFQQQQVKRMMTAFSNQESIHVEAYAYLLKTLGVPDEEFRIFNEYPVMRNKVDALKGKKFKNAEEVCLALAKFAAFTEGMTLFSSFAILLNFSRSNLLKGVGDIVSWSARDEALHVQGMTALYKQLVTESEVDIKSESYTKKLHGMAKKMVGLEFKFIDFAFKHVEKEGGLRKPSKGKPLTARSLKSFIKYLCDWRLTSLGTKGLYGYMDLVEGKQVILKEDPLPWFSFFVSGSRKTNFFERTGTEYAKASSSGTWDEAWEGLEI